MPSPLVPPVARHPGHSTIEPLAAALLLAGICASIKIALANILLGLAFLAWLLALRQGRARWRFTLLLLPLAGYIGCSLGAVVFSRDPRYSAGELGDLLTLGLVPMAVSLLDRQRWDLLVKALAAIASVSAAVGLWQYLQGASDLQWRLRGLLNHYMTFSGWTLLVILVLVADIVFHPDRRRRWWSLPACLLCISALLLSYTRNAWVGLATSLLVVIWRPRAITVLLAVALALLLLAPAMVQERLVSIVDLTQESNYDRLCMARSGIDMVADAPLFGLGLGMVQRYYADYRVADAPRTRLPHLHNNLIQIAAERGLLCLACYLALLALFVREAWPVLRDRSHPAFAAVAGSLLAVAGVTVAGNFEYSWGDAEVWILTLTLLAVPRALADRSDAQGQQRSHPGEPGL